MHIFISYAKLDTRELALKLQAELRQLPDVTVWMDESIEFGKSWATQIQNEIRKSDIVVVLLSPDVNRDPELENGQSFVVNEIEYAQRRKKPIIPVMVEQTDMPIQIGTLQYIDFTKNHATGTQNLVREIARRANNSLSNVPITPINGIVPDVSPQTPTGTRLISPVAQSPSPTSYRRPAFIIGFIALVVIILAAVIAPNFKPPLLTETPIGTSAALLPLSTAPSPTNDTPIPTVIPTTAPTLTAAPTLEIGFIVQTLDSEATVEQSTRNVESTAAARATDYAVGTQSMVNQTATATFWTATLTPNITASIEAYRTQQAATTTAQFLLGLTATATLWTATPTMTYTPTVTFTLSPTLPPTPTTLPLGFTPITKNVDWKPHYQTFNGYEMALVPVGCFMMGSTDGEDDEKPVNQQCFDQPFWIDRYEVTNQQYGSEGNFKGDSRPRESVNWFEARDFCLKRGARLPTEREWEYVARGTDNLVYPWGNEFVADNVVYSGNSNYQSVDVGSRSAGNSWVGASDLSGNVWEWVSSIYQPYSYKTDDGREMNNDSTDVRRALRGGSWNLNDSYMRSAFRNLYNPANLNVGIGFRCGLSYE